MGDMMIVRFAEKERPQPDDKTNILEGFSVAGEDGKFYTAHARYEPWGKDEVWTKGWRTIRVWSPLVPNPVALRYAWATSPMGNLKLGANQDIPYPNFRTHNWDLPESEDPEAKSIDRTFGNERKADAQARLEARRFKEADMGRALLERVEQLAAPAQ